LLLCTKPRKDSIALVLPVWPWPWLRSACFPHS